MLSPMLPARLLLLWTVALAACFQASQQHGFVLKPMSRQYQSYTSDPMEIRSWSPAECNGGGARATSLNYTLQWPTGIFDLCGDPWNRPRKYWNYPRRIAETYKAGDTIEVHQLITANHAGRMLLRLCPADVTYWDYLERCTVLDREDGKGAWWYLPPGEGLDNKKRPLIPKYEDKSFAWYVYQSNDDFNQVPVFVVKYKLPDGFTCDNCILHWYWLTGNTCNPSCVPEDPLYPNCDRNLMGYCGSHGRQPDKYPEEFWTCSDIKIE